MHLVLFPMVFNDVNDPAKDASLFMVPNSEFRLDVSPFKRLIKKYYFFFGKKKEEVWWCIRTTYLHMCIECRCRNCVENFVVKHYVHLTMCICDKKKSMLLQ